LRRWADPIVACDHFAQVEPLAEMCRSRGVEVRMLIEVNTGLDRVGVSPGRDTLELAQAIDRLTGVKLAGIMGYEGHLLQIAEPAEKEHKIRENMALLVGCKEQLVKSGIACDIVSAGGTGSYQYTVKCPGVTEVQGGGGIFMDPYYRVKREVRELDYALTLRPTVVSPPTLERAVLDAGRKTMNPDVAMPVVAG